MTTSTMKETNKTRVPIIESFVGFYETCLIAAVNSRGCQDLEFKAHLWRKALIAQIPQVLLDVQAASAFQFSAGHCISLSAVALKPLPLCNLVMITVLVSTVLLRFWSKKILDGPSCPYLWFLLPQGGPKVLE